MNSPVVFSAAVQSEVEWNRGKKKLFISDVKNAKGAFNRYPRPGRSKKPFKDPVIVAIDFECKSDLDLISLQFGVFRPDDSFGSKIVFVDAPTIDWDILAKEVLSFLNEEKVPLQQTIFLLTHWSIGLWLGSSGH